MLQSSSSPFLSLKTQSVSRTQCVARVQNRIHSFNLNIRYMVVPDIHIHTHASRNAVTLVWGSLRLAPIIESCQVGRLQLPFTLVYYGNYCTRGVALMLIQQCIRVCSKLGTLAGLPFSYPHSIPQQVVEPRVQSVLWKEDGRVTLVEKNITH